jgi:hypothetical protein
MAGDTLEIQAYLEDEKGNPVPHATVSLRIVGPQTVTLTTEPSDANGIAQAEWRTKASRKKGRRRINTKSGTYTVSGTKITAEGYSWDGITTSTTFIIQ